MSYARFCGFLPPGSGSREALELTRLFVGLEFDFQFVLVLAAGEVPPCRLGSTGPEATRLGWSTWLTSRPAARDVDDARFESEMLRAYHELPREDAA